MKQCKALGQHLTKSIKKQSLISHPLNKRGLQKTPYTTQKPNITFIWVANIIIKFIANDM
jgi:hypothetical protein